VGVYQLHITKSGKHGFQNELPGTMRVVGMLVLRYYKTDPSLGSMVSS
jgi:hypothetical protein